MEWMEETPAHSLPCLCIKKSTDRPNDQQTHRNHPTLWPCTMQLMFCFTSRTPFFRSCGKIPGIDLLFLSLSERSLVPFACQQSTRLEHQNQNTFVSIRLFLVLFFSTSLSRALSNKFKWNILSIIFRVKPNWIIANRNKIIVRFFSCA